MKDERYISVDIESSGPIVGKHSMLSIGACVVGDPTNSFYAELKPIGPDFDADALKVSGFDLSQLVDSGEAPLVAMNRFRTWLSEQAQDKKIIFVGFNACYDWQFVNWYLLAFGGQNPFGFSGIDIKSYYMGKCRLAWAKTTSNQLPQEYRPDSPQTHNALDDARAQASIFEKLLSSG